MKKIIAQIRRLAANTKCRLCQKPVKEEDGIVCDACLSESLGTLKVLNPEAFAKLTKPKA